ncbi:hypothetical protein [Erwinia sp. 9145]|uniref:hypothetical protein n=1 Tax=Erwinia sp. 9145 TaxID=1500895 RepID=UPI00055304AE|nr:hypothetical protein [Erwinia sp. 9145]
MNLEQISEKICDMLIASSYFDEANDIRVLMMKILALNKNDPNRVNAIDSLISRCHPKWLGDYYINNVTYKEWTDLITQFKNKLNNVK